VGLLRWAPATLIDSTVLKLLVDTLSGEWGSDCGQRDKAIDG
jgi:hypothetical protein